MKLTYLQNLTTNLNFDYELKSNSTEVYKIAEEAFSGTRDKIKRTSTERPRMFCLSINYLMENLDI